MRFVPLAVAEPMILKVALIFVLLEAATRVIAAEPLTPEERFDRLQREIDSVRAENRLLKTRVGQLERERVAASQSPVQSRGSVEMTDVEFRAKVAEVIKQEKPAPFVTPLGKELVLKLGGYIQGQAEFGDVDAWNGRFPEAANEGNDRFKIRRTRLAISGEYAEDFDFKVVGDFVNTDGSANRQSTFSAIDIFVNWHAAPEFQVKFGQFTAPFGLEMVTPDTTLFTAERALVSDSLAPDRLLGLQVWGYPFSRVLAAAHDKLVEYRFGIFNGNGRNRFFNDNESFLYAGRLQLNAFKPHTTAYSDNAYSATNRDVRLSLGVSGLVENQADQTTPLIFLGTGGLLAGGPATPGSGSLTNSFTFGSDYRREAWGVDVAARYGPFDLIAEYLQERFTPRTITPVDDAFTARGFFVIGSCFLPLPSLEKKFQAVEKFEYYEPSDGVAHRGITTLTSGLNYYLKGDDLKLMVDWLHTWSGARDRQYDEILTRLQLQF